MDIDKKNIDEVLKEVWDINKEFQKLQEKKILSIVDKKINIVSLLEHIVSVYEITDDINMNRYAMLLKQFNLPFVNYYNSSYYVNIDKIKGFLQGTKFKGVDNRG